MTTRTALSMLEWIIILAVSSAVIGHDIHGFDDLYPILAASHSRPLAGPVHPGAGVRP
jgi:hypothetical protein